VEGCGLLSWLMMLLINGKSVVFKAGWIISAMAQGIVKHGVYDETLTVIG
jgi:hypothetical protein